MSNRKQTLDEQLSVDHTKTLSSKSPVFKNTHSESKSYLYQSQVKRLKGLPRKTSAKYLKFTSANSISTGTRDSVSDNRKKTTDLRAAPNPYLQFNESITTKKKQLNMRDTNINNFSSRLEKKLTVLQKFHNYEAAEEYFEVLDEIIERDLLFGTLLKKIRNGLRLWYEQNQEMVEYCRSLETKVVEKQSVINQYLIANRHDFSKFNELDHEEITEKSQTCKVESQKYVFVPLVDWEEAKKKLEIYSSQVVCLQGELSDFVILQQKMKEMEKTSALFQEKESKFNLLLKALQDRGYPVDKVYERDVLNFSSAPGSQVQPVAYYSLKKEHILSSDSSITSSHEYL